MKSLPIDKNFSAKYVRSIYNFASCVLTSPHIRRDRLVFESMQNLKAQAIALEKQFNKRCPKENNIQIKSFPIKFINEKFRNDDNDYFIHIGGIISFEEGVLVSQSICFTIVYDVYECISDDKARMYSCHEYETGKHVIRKFHFDIDRQPKGEPRPLSHLQYGGSFKPDHFNNCSDGEVLEYKLFSNLDTPRLPGIPYSFETCLDIILRSFNTNISSITSESWWKEKVIDSEEFWIIPFLKSALENLGSNKKETFYDFMLKKASD